MLITLYPTIFFVLIRVIPQPLNPNWMRNLERILSLRENACTSYWTMPFHYSLHLTIGWSLVTCFILCVIPVSVPHVLRSVSCLEQEANFIAFNRSLLVLLGKGFYYLNFQTFYFHGVGIEALHLSNPFCSII